MNYKRLVPHLITLVLAALLMLTQQIWADPIIAHFASEALAVPTSSKNTINYQGYLTDSSGNPVNDSLGIIFRLYNVESGGAALWTEVHSGVTVSNGLFSVLLGSFTQIPTDIITNNDNLWLGIDIGAAGEMSPREKMASAPYAMLANVPDGSITQAQLADNAVISEKIANGAVQSHHIQPTMKYIYKNDIQSTSSTSWQDVSGTSLTLDIDSDQDIMIWGQAHIFQSGTDYYPGIRIVANDQHIASASSNGGGTPGGARSYETIPVMGVYSASSGTVEIKMQFYSGANYGTVYIANRNLFAMAIGR